MDISKELATNKSVDISELQDQRNANLNQFNVNGKFIDSDNNKSAKNPIYNPFFESGDEMKVSNPQFFHQPKSSPFSLNAAKNWKRTVFAVVRTNTVYPYFILFMMLVALKVGGFWDHLSSFHKINTSTF